MKKIIYGSVLASLLMAGCMRDEGTYDDRQVNKTTIVELIDQAGEPIDGNITVQVISTLKLTPVMEQSVAGSGDTFRYRWYIYRQGLDRTEEITISEERDLDWVVTAAPALYTVMYVVTNEQTGASYWYQFGMTVVEGNIGNLMVASNVDGTANLSILKTDGTWLPDIYQAINGHTAGTNAIAVVNARLFQTPSVNNSVLLCDDGSGGAFFNNINYEEQLTYRDAFYEAPAVIKPEAFFRGYGNYGYSDNIEFIINDGKLHYRFATQISNGAKFSPALAGDHDMHHCGITGFNTYLFYDNNNYRFWNATVWADDYFGEFQMKMRSAYIYTSSMFYDPSAVAAFDPDNVGLEMIYFGSIFANWEDLGYAIMRDPQNPSDLYRLKFFGGGLQDPGYGSNYWWSYWKQPIAAANEIADAVSFTISKNNPYIYYAVGSRIFLYNIENDNNRLILDISTLLPGNGVDHLYIQHAGNNMEDPDMNYRLWVGASPSGGSGKCGSILDIRLMLNGEYESHTLYKEVVGKVVSMDHQM